MNSISVFFLKCLRHAYQGIWGMPSYNPIPLCNYDEGGEIIYKFLSRGEPCMIARYGANELNCVLNYLEINYGEHNIWKNIKGECGDWWWNNGLTRCMRDNAGFFPLSEDSLSKFSEMMLYDSRIVDVLAIHPAIMRNSRKIERYLPDGITYIPFTSYDAYFQAKPWTRFLIGKRVLVVHPFSELIESQFDIREKLFNDSDVLPNFTLRTVKAVQTIGGVSCGFKDWFEALDWMKVEMDKEAYDIVLIGCGAYGFPLAAHAKRTGHQAIHIGSSLQLLFGIKGKRWENSNFSRNMGYPDHFFTKLMDNPYWVRPTEYKTKESEIVENACYW